MKTAIVTGGTSGIGLSVVHLLVEKGYKVYVTYRQNDLPTREDNVITFQADQADRRDMYKFIEFIKSETDHINCIVCNAGMTIRKPFAEFSDMDLDAMMEVSFNSHFILIREIFSMIQKDSRIIFTGSSMGTLPHATVLAYGIVKSAVHAFAKNLVKEFEGSGTTVNTIVPGFVETQWQKRKPAHIRKNICDKIALHRFADVEEITNAFKFCLENAYVNGSLIEIDGGYNYK